MNHHKHSLRAVALASALCVAACASIPALDLAASRSSTTEVWHVVLGEEFAKALAPRPGKVLTRGIPGTPLARHLKLAPQPQLSPAAVEAAALKEIRRIFKHLPVTVHFVKDEAALPVGAKKVMRLLPTDPMRKTLFGQADKIDRGNVDETHEVKLYLNSLAEFLRADPNRMPDPMKGDIWKAVESDELGAFFGVLICHEIGHTIGLRHNKPEAKSDGICLMTSGAYKFMLTKMGKAHLRWDKALIAHHALARTPVPAWIKKLMKDADGDSGDEGRGECSCPHCGGK